MAYKIGDRIRQYRERKHYTQKEFAEKIGVSNSRVSNWEQGINRPDVDILKSICEALEVSPSELLDVRLDPGEFSEHEKQLIKSYRMKADLQKAVDILLDLKQPRST